MFGTRMCIWHNNLFQCKKNPRKKIEICLITCVRCEIVNRLCTLLLYMSQSALARPNDDKKVVTIEISFTYAGVTQSGSRELHKTLQTLFGDPFITL